MSARSRNKGRAAEQQIVRLAEARGLDAERCWANAQHPDPAERVKDVRIQRRLLPSAGECQRIRAHLLRALWRPRIHLSQRPAAVADCSEARRVPSIAEGAAMSGARQFRWLETTLLHHVAARQRERRLLVKLCQLTMTEAMLSARLHGDETQCMVPRQGRRFDGQGESMARRRYQVGWVFLRGKNPPKWIGRWREDIAGQDGIVRRVRHSTALGTRSELPTKRLAQRGLELILARINAPEYRPGRIATVAEFAERWSAEVLTQRKPSTIRAATSHLRCYILPQLGRLKLDELGRERQQVFVTRVSQRASRKTVLNVIGTLSSMMATAKKWGYISETVKVGELALPDEGVRPEARFFTAEQVRQIIGLAGEPFRTIFAVAAMTGLRAGELLGLQVEDLDFTSRLIFVRRSVHRGRVQSVKSRASQKPLPMPAALASILTQYLAGWRENPERWLFVNRRGRPYSADKVVMFKLWPILDALKVPRCGLHAFRHFHSSMLLEVGAAPQVAQAQMRHSDARITLEVYSHVVGESQRKAVERVAEIVAPVGPKSDAAGEWIQ